MEDDWDDDVKLSTIVMNMKKEVCGIINPFLSFLTNMMKGGWIVIGNEVKVCS
jgi:hypothetical protein